MMYGLIQTTILTLIVAFSLMQLARKLMPQTMKSAQARLARALRNQSMPTLLQALSERVQPAEVPVKGCGDNAGCGSCNMCGTLSVLTRDLPKA